MIDALVEQIEARFAELEAQMSDPEVIGDRERYAEVGREYRELQPAQALAAEYRTLKDDLEGARELLEEGDDPELQKVVDEAPARIEALEEEIRLAMVERDPNDAKNVLVEIRAGTGGDEAALFAGDLYKMLTRYAEERGFSTEVALAVGGRGRRLQGGHLRDQGRGRLLGLQVRGRHPPGAARARDRVAGPDPHLDRDGRGAARGRGGRGRDRPERPADRRLPLLRARAGSRSTRPTRRCGSPTSRPGSSSRCRTRSPSCRTRSRAMRVLRARLYERELAEQQAKIASERKAQVGSGERSEKVRTYNFPQGRVTDHRIKLTSHNLDGVLGGELAEFTDALAAEEKRQRLEAAAGRMTVPGPRQRPRRARCRRRRAARPPASRARASTPSCCSPRRPGRDRAAPGRRSGGRGRRRAAARRFGEMVRRRLRREPVAYILGRRGFRRSSSRSTRGC